MAPMSGKFEVLPEAASPNAWREGAQVEVDYNGGIQKATMVGRQPAPSRSKLKENMLVEIPNEDGGRIVPVHTRKIRPTVEEEHPFDIGWPNGHFESTYP